jgi:UDP-2,4-diacetamido-2,4,6-trideoxy-beta-L-altropyranose hydrolase
MTTRLTLRRAMPSDARFVWEVNNHPSVRSESLSTAAIPWETHRAWFASKLVDPRTAFFVCACDGISAAVVRFDVDDQIAVVSVAVHPDHRGRGLGTRAIVEATARLAVSHPAVTPVAFVRSGNKASLRAFERAGYDRTGDRVLGGVSLERLEYRRNQALDG